MIANDSFLISVSDAITIYGELIGSINTIWNIYVFVLLGMVGWIVVRAHKFIPTQRILLTIVFVIFNSVILFYFYDAYSDIGKVRAEIQAHQAHQELTIVQGGISENLLSFDPIDRFISVLIFVFSFGIFVLFLIWSNKLWSNHDETPDP